MNVFNKMAALALLSTAGYTVMTADAADAAERRTPSATPRVAEASVDSAPVEAWGRVLDPKAYRQVSVSYQARAVNPQILKGAVFG